VCGVSECDREAPIMRGPWPTEGPSSNGRQELLFPPVSVTPPMLYIISFNYYRRYVVLGTDSVAQAVSRRPPTAEARV
jgi:hypothetical protein